MKNKLTLFFLLAAFSVSAQFGTINNGGFENWTQTGSYEQLNTWVTNAGQGVGLVEKSTDAQNLSFSVKLNTVDVDAIPTAGFLALGSFTGGLSGYPYTSLVDSMVCYLKYDFLPGDSGTVIVAQFFQGTPIPSFYKVGGTQNNWTRHAFDMLSPIQDSVIILFSAGDFLGGLANLGNYMAVDNVRLKGFLPSAALPNFSFETWDMVSVESPNGYQTSNDFMVQSGFSPNVFKTTDAHSGNFAVRIEPGNIGVAVVPGGIANGDFLTNVTGQVFSGAPVALEGFYKFDTQFGDSAEIVVEFYENGANIGSYTLNITTAANSYTPFSLWIESLSGTPDTMAFSANSGSSDGILFLDDLEFTGGNVSLIESQLAKIQMYPNPSSDFVLLTNAENLESVTIFQIDGTLVKKVDKKSQLFGLDVRSLKSGTYYVEMRIGNQIKVEKLVVE